MLRISSRGLTVDVRHRRALNPIAVTYTELHIEFRNGNTRVGVEDYRV